MEEATGCVPVKILAWCLANEMQALSTQAVKHAWQESNDTHKGQFNHMLYSCLE
jgi:hypothetical protein